MEIYLWWELLCGSSGFSYEQTTRAASRVGYRGQYRNETHILDADGGTIRYDGNGQREGEDRRIKGEHERVGGRGPWLLKTGPRAGDAREKMRPQTITDHAKTLTVAWRRE